MSEDIEVIPTSLEKELEKPHRQRAGHPSKAYSSKSPNRLTAREEAVAKARAAKSGKPRKTKQFDGRSLRGNRPRTDRIMKVFYEEVDLPEFKEALQFSKDPKFRMLFEAISAPTLHKCSFAELCRRCGLSIQDISGIYRDHQKHRGLMRAYNHMPQIMEDTAIDAQTRTVPCEVCEETGKVTDARAVNKQKSSICPRCHGDGRYRVIGDKESRQLMFETAGLKRGGMQTAVQVNVGAMPALEDMISEVEDVLDITNREEDNVRNGSAEGFKQISEGSKTFEESDGSFYAPGEREGEEGSD